MKISGRISSGLLFFVGVLFITSCADQQVHLYTNFEPSSRTNFGLDKLNAVFHSVGYTVVQGSGGDRVVEISIDSLAFSQSESYQIEVSAGKAKLTAKDQTGVLYACLDLKRRIAEQGGWPADFSVTESPAMVLRGTCIGLQKTEYLPGRTVYEYPYTPANFPWFYDKEHWVAYLDMMVENRYNSLYLWNGHPFASLVKLEDYPYALEVSEETFKKNEAVFSFITTEAEKRGIWVIQMFYNIILSKPFAEKHNLKTQERSRPITPLIADYSKKSITAFIEKYPNVGLMVCLGEAMHTIEDDVDWFTQTIIPGVKEGLQAIGRADEPPIVLRGHDTDAKRVMEAALPIYKNLYTTFKYNGESLTTYEPRDDWSSIPTALSELGSVHISNVHILANLEPFRYGSPDFIQKSVKAMQNAQGANGLHLYPQSAYWDWPYTADKTEERLLQIDRDWMWYQSWARYAWNPDRKRSDEMDYWSKELDDFYGSETSGKDILQAYEEIGEIAPKLLRTFGISDGNRQTLLLGMFMGQLVNPYKYHVYQNFLSSNGPVGEILIDYAKKEWNGETHVGETPPRIIEEVVRHGQLAVAAIDKASSGVTLNKAEFERLKNDVYCYNAFANFFAEKVKAAMLVLRYQYSNELADLEAALPYLAQSLEYYEELVSLTEDTYLYANSMQTAQRRIPITGRDGKNKTWAELLPHYQTELDVFKRNIEMLKSGGDKSGIAQDQKVFEPVQVTILNKDVSRYPLAVGQQVFSDNKSQIKLVTEELKKLSGVKFSDSQQRAEGTMLKFKCEKPVKVLVGYFNTNSYTVLEPPTLETNAQANDRGQADIKIANAMLIPGLYPVNVYNYHYPAGEHELVLGKGRVLILGFIDGEEEIQIHDAGMTDSEDGVSVDWLFY